MDAYDIFKKLTKGLTFKHRVLGVKINQPSSKNLPIKKEEIQIKTEAELSDFEEEQQNESAVSQSESEHEENDLQLVEGVTIGQTKRKNKKKIKTEDLEKKLKLEEENRFRNEHGIKTVGRHVPAALQNFSDLVTRYNVPQTLVDTVTQCGYSEPTPVQRQALPCMLEDRQILACAPTGSGKTAAFLVPILQALGAARGGPRALVLCPTRELAQQTHREALRLSAATQLRCSVVRNMKESKVKEREATIRKSDIIISTPNRLCYLLNQDNVNITLEHIRWLIIDEADKMFEGSTEQQSDFRQQLEQIMAACGGAGSGAAGGAASGAGSKVAGGAASGAGSGMAGGAAGTRRRVALFSATHTPCVARWARNNLRGLINITVGQRNAATNLVDQELLYCGNENGKLVAFRQLVQKGLKPPVLVFVQSKERAKQLFKELIYDGINVDVIHADRTQLQRDNVVRSFRVGRIWVLICTELLGRGIDFRGVNLVVNYDFPPSAITYIHRVGRAGRAGQRGRAITFFTQDDVVNLRSIAAVMKQSGCDVPEYMLKLKQNPNKRKKLAKKAPHRDKISTILEKHPEKRKLEVAKILQEVEASKSTESVKSGKNKKLRKLQNGGKQDGGQNEVAKQVKGNKTKGQNKNKNPKNKSVLRKKRKAVS